MRIGHFEKLQPVCPVCRYAEKPSSHDLRLEQVIRTEGEHVIEGILHCSNPACLREYPVIDGIPIIIPNIRQYISNNFAAIHGRRDLSHAIESLLNDCCGQGSYFDTHRQHLSSYVWEHYSDFDAGEVKTGGQPGSMRKVLAEGLKLAGNVPAGPSLEIGCAVGRGTFALAEARPTLTLGADLNFGMLRVAARALRDQRVSYDLRRVGVVYDRREFSVHLPAAHLVDFWALDALALPFRPGQFAAVVAMNVLDCTPDPRRFLEAVAAMLPAGGKGILACPYDWSVTATPVEAWLGGHSQRSKPGGSSEEILRILLTPDAAPGSLRDLQLLHECEQLPWMVRLHARSEITYQTHLVVVDKVTPKS